MIARSGELLAVGVCVALVALVSGCRDAPPGDTAAPPGTVVIVPVPVAVPGPLPAVDAGAASSDGPNVADDAPAAPRVEHAVWRLGPNRILAHRLVDGDLVVDGAAAGFARYTRFGMPQPRWSLRRVVDGAGAAVADELASLELPLTRDQATARALVLRVHAEKKRRGGLTVKINGRKASGKAQVTLEKGWQTVVVPVARGRLRAGENQVVLETRRGDDLGVAWLRVARARSTADPRGAATYDPVLDRFHLVEGAGLAWFVQIPEGARLVATLPDAACRIEVAARAGDGTFVGGLLGGGAERVDLSPVGGRVVRLALSVRDCPLALLGDAAITVPGAAPAATPSGPPPRYVILWMMDALRADRVRPFEPGARADVPNFEALAKTGAVFRQYYVQGNESQTSHSSVWTSTYPAVHNVRMAGVGGNWRIPPKLRVLGEAMADAGLSPIGVTGNGFVTKSPGYARGFVEYRNMMREKGVINGVLLGADVLRDALGRLDKHREAPTFLFLGTVDTHSPWIARRPWIDRYDPEPYDGPHDRISNPVALGIRRGIMGCSRVPEQRDLQRLNAIYDSAVSYHDARLGDLVAALRKWGIYDETMIVVTADHGEEWFEDGRCGHGGSLRESLVRVPLLVHYPPRVAASVVEEGAEGVDVLPTILDALGAAPLDQAQGASLRALAAGDGRGWVRPSYASQYEYAHAMRLGRWKARVGKTGVPRIIDVVGDPLERNDLAGVRPIERRFMTDALGMFLHWRRAWKKRTWGVVTNLEPAGGNALGGGAW